MLSASSFRFSSPEPIDFLPPNRIIANPAAVTSGFSGATVIADPLDVALRYLTNNAESLGLKASDVADPIVTSRYTDADSGITHLYLQQTFNGLPVKNADMTVNISRDNRLISAGGSFIPLPAGRLAAATPTRSPSQIAIDTASGLDLVAPFGAAVVSISTEGDYSTVLRAQNLSQDDIPLSLHYLPTETGLELAWDATVRTRDDEHWFNISVSDADGTILHLSDWIDHDAAYNVYPRPVEMPDDGPRSIVTNPHDPAASPFGWHDTNGVAGNEFTDTRGNNVYAQEDADNNDTGGFRPDGGASTTFDFPVNLAQAPSTYQSAAITNLFYWNNLLHDIHYKYGFTESAGNFQQNNYGNGGAGNDQVMADAQDGSGTNNANFGTPPDGISGRMQMYLFTYTSPGRDGDFDNPIIIHEYGHGVSNRLTGGPANSNALDATQSGGMGEGWSDWWGLMLTQKPTDTKMAAYSIGTYVLGESPSGTGIRRKPYSFDMTIDPLTMDSYGTSGTGGGVSRSTEVHDTGEIWCSVLWDLNWLLIDRYGFSADLSAGYTGAGSAGNVLALKLVMDALKLQPANPTFMQARDAIIQADALLTGGQNAVQIWTAFARRGMGFSAGSGSTANSTTVTPAYNLPPTLLDPTVLSISPTTITGPTATSLNFTFSKAMDPASFSVANDVVSFTGPAAQNLLPTITGSGWSADAKTLTINFTQLPADGQYTMVIGPNILAADNAHAMNQDGDGTPGEAVEDRYTANFRYDAVPLAVTSTTPAQGSTAQLPLTSIVLTFNENVLASSVAAPDLTISQGSVTNAAVENGNQIRFTISNLGAEGTVNYTLAAGKVTDVNGGANLSYSGSFIADFGTVAFPSLTQKNPPGSIVFSNTTAGNLSAGDTDTFSINLDAGQQLSVWLDPAAALRPTITLKNPLGTTIGTNTASAANIEAVLNSVAAPLAGAYTVDVTGAAGTTGTYTLGVALNAALEAELHDGAANDTRATAQNLDNAFTTFGPAVGSRAAVLGKTATTSGVPVITEGFESGSLGGSWTTYSSAAAGRIRVTGAQSTGSGNFALTMDNGSDSGISVLNEAIWTVDLTGIASPSLNFQHISFSDENESFSGTFTNHANADGVAVSADGTTWHPLFSADSPTAWTQKSFDLTNAASAAGIPLGANFKIKFQQYDNFAYPTDGRGFDDISISTPASSNDYYALTLAAGQSLSASVTAQTPGTVSLQLEDSAGNVLTLGAAGATNTGPAVVDFVSPAGGTYYLATTTSGGLDYNMVVTKDVEFDRESNDTTAVAQPIASRFIAGEASVLGHAGTTNVDVYAFFATAGSVVDLTTFTPGSGAGEPANLLDPRLRVFRSSGTLVASDDNSAADGRNAHATFTAQASEWHYVEVAAAGATLGVYGLSVKNAAPATYSFNVTSQSPASGSTVSATPAAVSLNFDNPVLLSTVQASDVKIDGIDATSFTVIDADTISFALPADVGQGAHTVSVAAGAMTNLRGTPLAAYNGTFTIDSAAPRVVTSSIAENDIRTTGTVAYSATFDKAVNPVLTAGVATLVGTKGNAYNHSTIAWSNGNKTVSLSFTGVIEDSYTLTLFSGDGKFEGVSGLDLDGEAVWPLPAGGSGNGVAGGNFVVHFSTDITTTALASPTAKQPLGSQVYERSLAGVITPAGDTDAYTISLDAGQTLSLAVRPTTAGLIPTITLTGPAATTIGSATASGAGLDALLQTASVATAGTYTITVGGGASSGSFLLRAMLNAAIEAESFGGPTNDTRPTAQSLDTAFTSLGGVIHAAVVGSGAVAGGLLYDFTDGAQGFTIDNGSGATAGLWHLSNGRGNDAGHSATQSFYFGQGETIAGGGTFNTGSQTTGSLISPSFVVPASASVGFNYILVTENSTAWDLARLQIRTNGGGAWTTLASYNGVSESSTWKAATPVSLSAYAGQNVQLRWFFDSLDSVGNNYEGWYVDDVRVTSTAASTDVYSVSLTAGQRLTSIISAVSGSGSLDVALVNSAGAVLATSAAGPTNFGEAISNFDIASSGTYYLQVTVPATVEYNLAVIKDAVFDAESNNTVATAQTIAPKNTAMGYLGSGDSDYYSLTAAPGTLLNITTFTPGDLAGEFGNTLNPRIELFDPSGTMVAGNDNSASDGRNALLDYTTLAGGTYAVRITAAANAGEYALKVVSTPNGPPGVPDLLAASDSGLSSVDNITNLNNSAGKTLQFSVAGTIAGATIDLYANGTLIGSAVASGATTLITTNGSATIGDGVKNITARQTVPASPQSADSPALSITIDTAAPTTSVPDLQNASDTGPSVVDNYTNATAPKFDINISEAGVVHLEFDGSSGTGPFASAAAAGTVAVTYPSNSPLFASSYWPTLVPASTNGLIADFNGDTRPDLVTATAGVNLTIVMGAANNTYLPQATILTNSAAVAMVAADFNNDDKLDLVIAPNANYISVLLGKGDGTFHSEAVTLLGQRCVALAVADVNHDNKLDVIGAGQNGSLLRFFGNADGTFQAPVAISTLTADKVMSADLNSDGNPDLIALRSVTAAVNVLLGNADGSFAPAVAYESDFNVRALATGDFDGDGATDIAAVQTQHAVVYFGNGNGTFKPRKSLFMAPSPGLSIATADFNLDGRDDIALGGIGGELQNFAEVFLGRADQSFDPLRSFFISARPTTLSVADFNNDNAPDLASFASNSSTLSMFVNNKLSPSNLTDGVHNFTSWAEDVAGNVSSPSAALAVTFDTVAPVATITPVSPDPRSSNVGSIQIVFNEQVTNFDLTDLALTRNGSPVALTGATLTSADFKTFTLGNLSSLTGVNGTYELKINVAGSLIIDNAANALTSAAPETWVKSSFSASINGQVFNDPNSNGVYEAGELPISGWTVYLDANNNNTLDAGETSTVTNAAGSYSFTGLVAGTYHVKQQLQSGYRKTLPGAGVPGYSVTLADGQTAFAKDFNNTTNILLAGVVFRDDNANGQFDSGESPLPGVVVNVISNNTIVATRTTSAAGLWQVKGLSAGTGHADVIVPAGYTPTIPVGGTYAGTMTSGQQNAFLNFGLRLASPAPFAATKPASSVVEGKFDTLSFFDERDVWRDVWE